jgi:hypothetical protein
MSYRMKEMTDNVRVGRPSDGSLNVEVWQVPRGWEAGSAIGPMEEIIIPSDAVDEIFQYLR